MIRSARRSVHFENYIVRLLSARRCRLRLPRVASDHLPVVADFEID